MFLCTYLINILMNISTQNILMHMSKRYVLMNTSKQYVMCSHAQIYILRTVLCKNLESIAQECNIQSRNLNKFCVNQNMIYNHIPLD